MSSIPSSSLCRLLAVFLALSAAGNAEEADKRVQFKVSGPVAEKLPDDVRVVVWAPDKDPVRHVGDAPILMPWRHFLRFNGATTAPAGAFVGFRNDKGERITSVLLSPDLFDVPRTIDITLKRPEPFVRPTDLFGVFGFRYHALISRRMQYSEVPRWNAKTKKFLKPSPPVLQVHDAATRVLLQESEMLLGCYGYGWMLRADFPAEPPHGRELRVTVVHDTGDLFGRLKAACSFAYRKEHRGE